jgi:RimJ/RimL family protein N-acetyltransferase
MTVALRPATEADAGRLLAWRNDPDTRGWSRDTAEVPLADHVSWLRGVLASPDRVVLIAESAGVPVGTVRFDRLGEGRWEVSITVAPAHRGRGLAADMLAAGEETLRRRGRVHAVLATVHRDNVASRALFSRAGYGAAEQGGQGAFLDLQKSFGHAESSR